MTRHLCGPTWIKGATYPCRCVVAWYESQSKFRQGGQYQVIVLLITIPQLNNSWADWPLTWTIQSGLNNLLRVWKQLWESSICVGRLICPQGCVVVKQMQSNTNETSHKVRMRLSDLTDWNSRPSLIRSVCLLSHFHPIHTLWISDPTWRQIIWWALILLMPGLFLVVKTLFKSTSVAWWQYNSEIQFYLFDYTQNAESCQSSSAYCFFSMICIHRLISRL